MNLVILTGNLTNDPIIKKVAKKDTGEILVVARYLLAVNREISSKLREEEPEIKTADFVSVVCFNKKAEFAGKYLKKGMRIVLKGKLRSSDYINKYNQRVFITEVLCEKQEFAQSKKEEKNNEEECLDGISMFDVEEIFGDKGDGDDSDKKN